MCIALLLTVIFCFGESVGIVPTAKAKEYESRLFDSSKVHTVDIVADDWEEFLENCTDEQYILCTVVIDGEAEKNVGLRAKGNTSLTSVKSYGNNRYSFKIEFDHYDSTNTYYGLDKLCLNNIIQDNTYMKDFLCYKMMYDFGVSAPLCSYAFITVNGEDFGLYLAVEGVEESFLSRNYGNDYGELYKPDSQSMGGGRGNGKDFDQDMLGRDDDRPADGSNDQTAEQNGEQPQEGTPPAEQDGEQPQEGTPPAEQDAEQTEGALSPTDFANGDKGQGGDNFINGSSDVLLQYTDDEFDSYKNIFDNAKTDPDDNDKARLIQSLKSLSEQENIEQTVDVDEVTRYFAVHNFVLNFDSYTGSMIHNYYLYEKDGRLSMIPWDYNLAFGGFGGGGQDAVSLVNYPIDTPVSGGSAENRPMLYWMLSDEQYLENYHMVLSEFIEMYFDSGYFERLIDQTESLISPYVERDPTKFCTYDQFKTGLSTLREFCLLRAQSVKGQLDGTVPSTSEGQSSDSSALISADGISIDDMGSMSGGANGGSPDRDKAFPGKSAFGERGSLQNRNEQDGDSQNGGGEDGSREIFGDAPDDLPDGRDGFPGSFGGDFPDGFNGGRDKEAGKGSNQDGGQDLV